MPNSFDPFSFSTVRRYSRYSFFLAKWAMWLLSASVETYLRTNFGRRYLWMLAGSFLFFLFCTSFVPAPTVLTGLFLLCMFALVITHFICVFRRRRLFAAEPISSSAGDSWNFWQRSGLAPSTVQRYLEPVLCGSVGWIISAADKFLGIWLMASAVSLFIKEQISRVRVTRRIIDANDAKVSAQSLNTGVRHYQQGAGQAAQKSHRVRFPNSGQAPRP